MKRLVFVSKACKLPVRFQQCAGQSWMADYGWFSEWLQTSRYVRANDKVRFAKGGPNMIDLAHAEAA